MRPPNKLIINTIDENKFSSLSSTIVNLSTITIVDDVDPNNRTVLPSFDYVNNAFSSLKTTIDNIQSKVLGFDSNTTLIQISGISDVISSLEQLSTATLSNLSSYDVGSTVVIKNPDNQTYYYTIQINDDGTKEWVLNELCSAAYIRSSDRQSFLDQHTTSESEPTPLMASNKSANRVDLDHAMGIYAILDDIKVPSSRLVHNTISSVIAIIDDLNIALSTDIDNLSTVLSDEIDSLSTDLSTEIDNLSTALSGEIDSLSTALSGEIDNLSTALSGEIDSLSTTLSGEIDNLSTSLSGEIDSLSTALSGEIDSLSTALSGEIDSLSTALSGDIDSLSTALSGDIDSLSTALSGDIDSLSTVLSDEIDSLSTALSTEISSLSTNLSTDIDQLSADVYKDLSIKMTTTIGNGDDDVLSTFTFTQNGKPVGIINLPKDKVIESAKVVFGELNNGIFVPDDSGSETVSPKAKFYLEITVANQNEKLYIHVPELVDTYVGHTGQTIKVEIKTDNEGARCINANVIDKSLSFDKLADDLSNYIQDINDRQNADRNVIEILSGDDNTVGSVKNYIKDLSSTVSADIGSLSTALSTEISSLSTNLSTEISSLSIALSGEISSLSTALSTEISSLSTALSTEISSLSIALSNDIDTKLSKKIDKPTDFENKEFYLSSVDGMAAAISSILIALGALSSNIKLS